MSAARPTGTPTAPPPPRPARILVVDDVEANVLVLSKMVKVLGYAPLVASGGARAIEVVRTDRPDLVLMDAMMPEIDGIEATRTIKSDPETRLIPVVMVTALSDARSKQRAIDAGADDFISKPVDSLELQIRMKALLAVKRTYDELEAARRTAAEQDRLKAELLSATARGLEAPLSVIASAARALLEGRAAGPDQARGLGQAIHAECERLGRLLARLVASERAEGGAEARRGEVFLAADVVNAAADSVRALAEEKGLVVAVHVRPSGPAEGRVRGDREQLVRALVHLARNAVEHTPRGGAVRLASARVDPQEAPRWGVCPLPGAGAVLLAVEDTGVGIAPERQARLLASPGAPAYGAPGGVPPEGSGLARVREVFETHGGRIGLRSEVGKGSRFTIALPEAPP